MHHCLTIIINCYHRQVFRLVIHKYGLPVKVCFFRVSEHLNLSRFIFEVKHCILITLLNSLHL